MSCMQATCVSLVHGVYKTNGTMSQRSHRRILEQLISSSPTKMEALHSTNTEDVNAESSVKCSMDDDPESFYQKFAEFFDSTGLSLLFNLREAILDLYLFYKEVIQRGGFYQVSKTGKWGEVASALKLKDNDSKLCIQLQKLYANLLYRFEMTFAKPTTSQTSKRKCQDANRHPSLAGQACPKRPLKNKETKKDPDAPLRKRSAYQLFVSKECDRLKSSHKDILTGESIRKLAIDSWRHLSESDREPYREESRKDSERFDREMAIYKERKQVKCDLQDREEEKRPRQSNPNSKDHQMRSGSDKVNGLTPRRGMDNVYVPVVIGTSAINLANDKKNGMDDPLSQINWEEYCGSLDICE